MAEDTVAERDPAFNQSSESSLHSRARSQLSNDVEKLEYVAMLLAQADALSSFALRDAFCESCPSERHHYLAALNEIIVAAREQLDDVLGE